VDAPGGSLYTSVIEANRADIFVSI